MTSVAERASSRLSMPSDLRTSAVLVVSVRACPALGLVPKYISRKRKWKGRKKCISIVESEMARFSRPLRGPFSAVSTRIFATSRLQAYFAGFFKLYKIICTYSSTSRICEISGLKKFCVFFANLSAISSKFTRGSIFCKISSAFADIQKRISRNRSYFDESDIIRELLK